MGGEIERVGPDSDSVGDSDATVDSENVHVGVPERLRVDDSVTVADRKSEALAVRDCVVSKVACCVSEPKVVVIDDVVVYERVMESVYVVVIEMDGIIFVKVTADSEAVDVMVATSVNENRVALVDIVSVGESDNHDVLDSNDGLPLELFDVTKEMVRVDVKVDVRLCRDGVAVMVMVSESVSDSLTVSDTEPLRVVVFRLWLRVASCDHVAALLETLLDFVWVNDALFTECV